MRISKLRFGPRSAVAILLSLGGIAGFHSLAAAQAAPTAIEPPVLDSPKAAGPLQTAVLAGGCFWGVQGVFQRVHGVRKVVSGYTGGSRGDAHYDTVSTGTTGHAESVKITFDPAVVSYGKLLQIFFSVVHDPTQLDRQGPDEGTQYRSAIFYVTEEQRKIAQTYIGQLNASKAYRRPIATRVDPLKGFYPAEAYHQNFLIRNPRYPYIVFNDLPKIDHLERLFPGEYTAKPARAR